MMTVHKLTAGDGYTYLTRQVASADEPRAPGQSLADYYVARGNPPGVWLGGGRWPWASRGPRSARRRCARSSVKGAIRTGTRCSPRVRLRQTPVWVRRT